MRSGSIVVRVAMVIVGGGLLLAPLPAQARRSTAFTTANVARQQRAEEPRALAVRGTDIVYVVAPEASGGSWLWRSDDGGRTFAKPIQTNQGSFDSDVAVDPADPSLVYVADLADADRNFNIPISVSTDGGRSFTRTTVVAPTATGMAYDRPWLVTPGPGRLVVVARDANSQTMVSWVSADRGTTFEGPFTIAAVTRGGNAVVGPDGRITALYVNYAGAPPTSFTENLYSASSVDGVHWHTDLVAENQDAEAFPVVAADNAGNLYATWADLYTTWSWDTSKSNPQVVRLAVRPAGAATWSTPVVLSDPTTDALGQARPAMLPWVVADESGRVAVSYAIADEPINIEGDVAPPTTAWDLTVAHSIDADQPGSHWTTTTAAARFHTGSICMLGLQCASPSLLFYGNLAQPFDRREGDLLGATLLDDGRIAVPFDHDRPPTTGDPNDITHSAIDIQLAIGNPR